MVPKKREIADQRQKNNQLQQQINSLATIIAQVEDFKKKKQDRNSKIQVIRKLNEGRSGPVKMLDEFTYTTPDKLWVDSFRESKKRVEISGSAVNGAVIADFVDNLRNSKFFNGVQLIQTQLQDKDGRAFQQFSVTMTVNYTPD